MREKDDLKVPGLQNWPEGDSLYWDGRRMQLNTLDLLNDMLFAPDKVLIISGSRNPLKLARVKFFT